MWARDIKFSPDGTLLVTVSLSGKGTAFQLLFIIVFYVLLCYLHCYIVTSLHKDRSINDFQSCCSMLLSHMFSYYNESL